MVKRTPKIYDKIGSKSIIIFRIFEFLFDKSFKINLIRNYDGDCYSKIKLLPDCKYRLYKNPLKYKNFIL